MQLYIIIEAVFSPSAVIASAVFIGPLCTIDEDVEIGQGTITHAGVHIYDHANISRNVIIRSGTVIGTDGFEHKRNEEGKFEKFPHGGVTMENDVEIEGNSCIYRRKLGNTVICQGIRIDNLVHVAHNVIVEKHITVIANAMIVREQR